MPDAGADPTLVDVNRKSAIEHAVKNSSLRGSSELAELAEASRQ